MYSWVNLDIVVLEVLGCWGTLGLEALKNYGIPGIF